MTHFHQAIVVGAGAAGIGVAIALRRAGIMDTLNVDSKGIGSAFASWPAETRFISPSFMSNPFGAVDLNAITPDTSPAYTLGVEHPSGREYRDYLRAVATHFELSIQTGTHVTAIEPISGGLRLKTQSGELLARNVVWAAGEFSHPRSAGFEGASLCQHTAGIAAFSKIKGRQIAIVGGYESGIDAATHLAADGRTVTVLDPNEPWKNDAADPSVSLAPFTRRRLNVAIKTGNIKLLPRRVDSVVKTGRMLHVNLDDGTRLAIDGPVLLATGFSSSAGVVRACWQWREEDDLPVVSEAADESTVTPGLFLAGPSLRHEYMGQRVIFCYIYKYRQRFAVVAREIGRRLGVDTQPMERLYRQANMFLDDLSCCGAGCAC